MKSQDDDNSLIETVEAEAGLEIQIWTSDFQHALEGHPEVTLDRVRNALKNPIKVVKSKKSNQFAFSTLSKFRTNNSERFIFALSSE